VIHSYNPNPPEIEAGGSGVQSQLGLHSEFQDSMGYIVIPCLKILENEKQQQKKQAVVLKVMTIVVIIINLELLLYTSCYSKCFIY
jgi:hypothetical protein